MRWLPSIDFGTEAYPREIARRLRALNIATWMAATLTSGFAAAHFASASPELRRVALMNAFATVVLAAIPLLHRFGSLAAPLALGIFGYPAIFAICSMVGTDTGMQMQYLVILAIMILTLGTKHVFILLVFAVASACFMLALELTVPGDTGVLPQASMLASFCASIAASCAILFAIIFYALRDAARAEARAAREFQRSEALLGAILPASIADRLKARSESIIADNHPHASVLFADMAGFTAKAHETSPDDLVRFLNAIFTAFDRLVEKHDLEKIKTTGDAYMVVSGVPRSRPDHAEALAALALDMMEEAKSFEEGVPIRIGIASGPVVAGVVGTKKFFYDVWGDTVNVASRMETTGEPGRIQVSPETRELLRDRFDLEPRGPMEIKGKGTMTTWFLNGPGGPVAAAS